MWLKWIYFDGSVCSVHVLNSHSFSLHSCWYITTDNLKHTFKCIYNFFQFTSHESSSFVHVLHVRIFFIIQLRLHLFSFPIPLCENGLFSSFLLSCFPLNCIFYVEKQNKINNFSPLLLGKLSSFEIGFFILHIV